MHWGEGSKVSSAYYVKHDKDWFALVEVKGRCLCMCWGEE